MKFSLAVCVDEVVKVDGFDFEFGRFRPAVHDSSALNAKRCKSSAVVQIAVVEVDRRTRASVAPADQARVAPFDAIHSAG
jgi:hypothetical protein